LCDLIGQIYEDIDLNTSEVGVTIIDGLFFRTLLCGFRPTALQNLKAQFVNSVAESLGKCLGLLHLLLWMHFLRRVNRLVRGGQFGKAGESPSVRGALNGHDYSGQSAGARLVNTGVGVASSSANAVFGPTDQSADQRGTKGDVAALLL